MLSKASWTVIFNLALAMTANNSCNKEGHLCDHDVLEFPVDFSDHETLKDLRLWLKSNSLSRSSSIGNCPLDKELPPPNEEDSLRMVLPPSDCGNQDLQTGWDGKLGKDGFPKGPGRLSRLIEAPKASETISGSNTPTKCVDILPGLEHYRGSLSAGGAAMAGRAGVVFEHDGTVLSGSVATGGIFHGRAVQTTSSTHKVLYVGAYLNGRAHGPGWIFSPGSANEKDGKDSLFVWFRRGRIDKDKLSLLFQAKSEKVYAGKLINGTYLENPREVEIGQIGEFNCVKVPEFKVKDDGKALKPVMKLSMVVKAFPDQGRLLIRDGRTLVFNRVAKTGSQAFTQLLVALGEKHNLNVEIKLQTVENLIESPGKLADLVAFMDKKSQVGSVALIQHINFFNFEDYGAQWNPIFINLVRHPVDRVISWFYYWRAGWNIVERIQAFPREPLPDPKRLRMDFDTCVAQGDRECTFLEGDGVHKYEDHRSQMSSFCGQERVCLSFNSEECLRQAKENVERYYSVVGVVEDMNKTLAVMERELPDIFSGASSLYYTENVQKMRTHNAFKMPVKKETWDKVAANFSREIEFYEFVRQRLDHQLEAAQT